MGKYVVEIKFKGEATSVVEADSIDEAENIARELFRSGDADVEEVLCESVESVVELR